MLPAADVAFLGFLDEDDTRLAVGAVSQMGTAVLDLFDVRGELVFRDRGTSAVAFAVSGTVVGGFADHYSVWECLDDFMLA